MLRGQGGHTTTHAPTNAIPFAAARKRESDRPTQLHNEEQYQGPRANYGPADNLLHSPITLRGPFSFLKMLLCQALECVQQCQLHPPCHVAVVSVPQIGLYATGTKCKKDTLFHFAAAKPVLFVSSPFQNAEGSYLSKAKPRNWEAHTLFGFLTKLLETLDRNNLMFITF